ncbi:unnamed protein product [Amoebophrya sp. A120]|nr:unnamed protein product [Amoebophrya sp. A120]|eukprot:GSA120T00005169001.1
MINFSLELFLVCDTCHTRSCLGIASLSIWYFGRDNSKSFYHIFLVSLPFPRTKILNLNVLRRNANSLDAASKSRSCLLVNSAVPVVAGTNPHE